jgi:hypothetical protein
VTTTVSRLRSTSLSHGPRGGCQEEQRRPGRSSATIVGHGGGGCDEEEADDAARRVRGGVHPAGAREARRNNRTGAVGKGGEATAAPGNDAHGHHHRHHSIGSKTTVTTTTTRPRRKVEVSPSTAAAAGCACWVGTPSRYAAAPRPSLAATSSPVAYGGAGATGRWRRCSQRVATHVSGGIFFDGESSSWVDAHATCPCARVLLVFSANAKLSRQNKQGSSTDRPSCLFVYAIVGDRFHGSFSSHF